MNTIDQGTYKPLGIIKKNLIPLTILLSFGLILSACNEKHNPVSNMSITDQIIMSESANTGVNTDPVDILGFEIKFNEREYDPDNDQTTFKYRVTRDNASGFNYLFFETPSCAVEDLLGYTPTNGDETVIGDGTTGIKWNSSIGQGSSRDYSVTYSGNQPLGMVNATIQGTGSVGAVTKEIPGPCKGIHTISGYVYVDENGNGEKNDGEGGIGNVIVHLLDDDLNVFTDSVSTSSNGFYEFNVFTGSTSTVLNIDIRTESNKLLFDNFSPTTTLPLEVEVDNANVPKQNVGFKPETGRIIERFENPDDEGGIKLRTEKPKFWADEFKFSTRGRQTVFEKDELLEFLKFELINELELTYTFNFKDHPDDDDIKKAKQILTLRGNSTEFQQLRAELLAAMLNVESKNGAVDDDGNPLKDFNSLILKVGAAAAVAQSSNGSSLMMNSTTHETTTFTITSQSLSSGNLLRSFNGGGGGVGN